MTDQGRLLMDGPSSRMTADAISQDRADQIPLLYEFAVEAGQIRGTTASAGGQTQAVPFPAQHIADQQTALTSVQDWVQVTQVGEGYIDKQCDAFVTALNDLERSKKTTLADLSAVQGATVGIMGLALAAQKTIGIVGIAFGLAATLFDTTTSTVLYQLPASGVASIVQAQKQFLRADEPAALAEVRNQGLAGARLSEYVRYCAPLTIEANIAKVLNNTKGSAAGISSDTTQPVVVSAFTRDVAFRLSLPTRAALRQQIDSSLNAIQLRQLAARMEPDLSSAGAETQALVRALDPLSQRFTDSSKAKQVLEVWVVYGRDPTSLQTWADAVRAVQGG